MSDTPKHDDMEVRHGAAAGLDVRKMRVTATVRTHAGGEGPLVETREFSALASGLALLVQWLLGLRVSDAVMEATGVYWEKSTTFCPMPGSMSWWSMPSTSSRSIGARPISRTASCCRASASSTSEARA